MVNMNLLSDHLDILLVLSGLLFVPLVWSSQNKVYIIDIIKIIILHKKKWLIVIMALSLLGSVVYLKEYQPKQSPTLIQDSLYVAPSC